MKPPNCTCFHSGPPVESLHESPTVTSFPEYGLAYLEWPDSEALLFTNGKIRLTDKTLDQFCPVHGVPPLNAPSHMDRIAFAMAKQGPRPAPTDYDMDMVGPLFADANGDLYSEPLNTLTQVGWVRPPYLYIEGIGGFTFYDSSLAEAAARQLLSKEVCRGKRTSNTVPI